jgi:hypothetical protein
LSAPADAASIVAAAAAAASRIEDLSGIADRGIVDVVGVSGLAAVQVIVGGGIVQRLSVSAA